MCLHLHWSNHYFKREEDDSYKLWERNTRGFNAIIGLKFELTEGVFFSRNILFTDRCSLLSNRLL